jgi:hypothetical protein
MIGSSGIADHAAGGAGAGIRFQAHAQASNKRSALSAELSLLLCPSPRSEKLTPPKIDP